METANTKKGKANILSYIAVPPHAPMGRLLVGQREAVGGALSALGVA